MDCFIKVNINWRFVKYIKVLVLVFLMKTLLKRVIVLIEISLIDLTQYLVQIE